MLNFILGVLGYGLAAVLLPLLCRLITRAGFVRPNYRGNTIPQGVGVVFFIVPLCLSLPVLIFFPSLLPRPQLNAFLALAGAMGFLGLLDDVFGSRRVSGLKGHFAALLRGRPTTGALKALGGLAAAFLVSLLTAPAKEVLLNTLVIALAANAVNLLDLRPGRAGKAYLLGALPLFAVGWSLPAFIFPLAMVTGAVLAYLPGDLRGRVMMGDAGANVLGAALGLVAVWVLGIEARAVVLAFLILFHLLCERYSLTEVIRRNRLLHFLDRLGRPGEETGDK
ncbi:MAG: hypothetical protein ACUVRC_02975 [Desulfotomaculales bacterium]